MVISFSQTFNINQKAIRRKTCPIALNVLCLMCYWRSNMAEDVLRKLWYVEDVKLTERRSRNRKYRELLAFPRRQQPHTHTHKVRLSLVGKMLEQRKDGDRKSQAVK